MPTLLLPLKPEQETCEWQWRFVPESSFNRNKKDLLTFRQGKVISWRQRVCLNSKAIAQPRGNLIRQDNLQTDMVKESVLELPERHSSSSDKTWNV